MEKEEKLVVVSIVTLVSFVLSMVLLFNDIINYFIVAISITIVTFFYLICVSFEKKDDKNIYYKKLKKILKTYDSLLVYSKDEIQLKDQNVIFVKNFKNLLVAQEEFNKPIIYADEGESSAFMLQDGNELLVYIMKLNENIDSRYENRLISFINKSRNEKKNSNSKILDDLEKTTIIQLKNNKTYKVSPVRKK